MRALHLASLLVLALLAGGLIWTRLPARTARIAGPEPLAELIPVEIGGMTQWLLIRGADREAARIGQTTYSLTSLRTSRA